MFITALILITTYSTAGIAILLIQGMIYIIKEFPKNKILAPLALLFLIPVYIIFTSNLNEKVYGEKEGNYTETHIAYPEGGYAKSKYHAEIELQKLKAKVKESAHALAAARRARRSSREMGETSHVAL